MQCYALVLGNTYGVCFGVLVLDMSMMLQGAEIEKVGEICAGCVLVSLSALSYLRLTISP